MKRAVDRVQALIHCPQVSLLLGGRRHEQGDGVGDTAVFAVFVHVVEECEHPIVVLLADRIVFVVVAAGAFHRKSQEGGARSADAVGDVFDTVFLVDDAAFAIDDVVTVEGRGEALVGRRLRQQVPGELFGDEAIEGQVGVKGFDDVIAPAPHGTGGVVVEAVRVGIAGDVEPVLGEAFAESGRGEQAVGGSNEGQIPAQGHVGLEGRDLGRRRRQARQVEGCATKPGGRRGRRGRHESLGFELRQHEAVKRLAGPGRVGDLGHGRTFRRNEGPVLLVLGALGDPAADEFDLRRRDLAVGFGRRHLLVRIVREQSLEHLALFRFAGDDRRDAVVGLHGFIADVETEVRLTMLRVLAVAVEAVLRKDRPDVAVEADVFRGEPAGHGKKN